MVVLPCTLEEPKDLYAPLVNGLTIGSAFYVAIWNIYPVSGGHCNPVVTFALYLTRHMQLQPVVFYWLAQFPGAMARFAMGSCLNPFDEHKGGFPGHFARTDGINDGQAIMLDVCLSFGLIVVYLSCVDDYRPDNWGLSSGVNMALAVSLAYTGGIIIAVQVISSITFVVSINGKLPESIPMLGYFNPEWQFR